ncbi:MAG: hypothetical protein Q8K64_07220 [Sediminibacterium sp.]|nr:MAG: hypothetical protein FD183_1240 [Chitinophagaceae bacterium]MDP1843197.1 hypothetical protein [Sediminibacterium sp.]TXT31458.1 MAG: hypothetical protein FD136_1476 [Chitinophagaceae bacterium]
MKTQTTILAETTTVKVSKPVFGLADFWNLERMRRVRSPRRNLN